jgi:hypothetical protein
VREPPLVGNVEEAFFNQRLKHREKVVVLKQLVVLADYTKCPLRVLTNHGKLVRIGNSGASSIQIEQLALGAVPVQSVRAESESRHLWFPLFGVNVM